MVLIKQDGAKDSLRNENKISSSVEMGEFKPLELYLDLVSNPPADNLTARVAGKCLED